jgi:Protein of unknown function (DUF4056)
MQQCASRTLLGSGWQPRLLVTALIAVLAAGGCTIGGPKSRLGSLPFPGALTLWDVADPASLGDHVGAAGSLSGLAESSRGTIYTCKAGFVDLAHLRESADWTKYAYDEIFAAFDRGDAYARFEDHYEAEYRVALAVPAAWSRFTPEARRSAQERASRIAAQRIAYLAMTWHEVATWFGERIIPLIPEDRSSFTYDDTIAHVIGVQLGGNAIAMVTQGEADDFDAAMTIVLEGEMQRLGALSADQTYKAALAVQGRWWSGESCIKRQLATGLDEAFMVPWVIRPTHAKTTDGSLDDCLQAGAEVQRLTWEDPAVLRSLAGILGPVEMRSKPYASTLGLTGGAVTPAPGTSERTGPVVTADGWVDARDFMRRCVDVLRVSMSEKLGADFDVP